MNDPTEAERRSLAPLMPAELEIRVDAGEQVWDTEALKAEFEVVGFMAPYVVVRRRSDGAHGSLMFSHSPRWYFGWQAEQCGRDLICPVCGEEWDLDTLHEERSVRALRGPRPSFTAVVRQFQREGCGVALRASCGPLTCLPDPATAELTQMARAIYDLLGDDIDGAINEIEDYRMMFGH